MGSHRTAAWGEGSIDSPARLLRDVIARVVECLVPRAHTIDEDEASVFAIARLDLKWPLALVPLQQSYGVSTWPQYLPRFASGLCCERADRKAESGRRQSTTPGRRNEHLPRQLPPLTAVLLRH